MTTSARRIDYFHATVDGPPGEACHLLTDLAELGVDLLAFNAVPIGTDRTQFTIFPSEDAILESAAKKAGLNLDGPHRAFLVSGDDELGALASVHRRLADADVECYASTGIADGTGSFGYIVYVRPAAVERAAKALGV